MFKLNLKDFCGSTSYYDGNNSLKFDPPVYEQRYSAVFKVLEHHIWEGKLRKIAEFGCSEMSFFKFLKKVKGVEKIMQIDIDEETLYNFRKRVDPLLMEYVNEREMPLTVEIYKGSIGASHDYLKDNDAVIGIEVIEHLYADVLEQVPFNIFGVIKPKLVIFTTPNSEFNILFNIDSANGFRHPDHKFEWNRKQFKEWCLNICARFPNYKVDIIGIGKGPPDKRHLGTVSQMCVFVRKDVLNLPLPEPLEPPAIEETEEFKLIYNVSYPFTEDKRNDKEKLLDDAKYYLQKYTYGDRWLNAETNLYEVPLRIIFSLMFPKVLTISELSELLQENEFKVENENIIVVPEEDEEGFDDMGYDLDGEINTDLDFQGEEECWD